MKLHLLFSINPRNLKRGREVFCKYNMLLWILCNFHVQSPQGRKVWKDTFKLIFLIYDSIKPNIDVSGWLYHFEYIFIYFSRNDQNIPPYFIAFSHRNFRFSYRYIMEMYFLPWLSVVMSISNNWRCHLHKQNIDLQRGWWGWFGELVGV